MSGKGGSSGGTTSQQSTVTPNPTALAAYQQALTMANSAASAPLQTYSGQQVAGFTPDQLAAFQTVSGSANAYSPYLSTASNDIQGSTANLWGGVPQFSAGTIDQYESPYNQNVLSTTMASENNQDAQQQQQVVGNAVSSGAWGGDRSAVAQAQLAGQQALANNTTNAGIENAGYNTALGEFNNQQSAQLSANEANAYLGEQAGFGNLNLASAATQLPLAQASAQNTTGTEEQQLAQEQLNVPYEQFLQQQAYPFQTAQYYADIAEGIGPGEGSTSTGSTTAPGASTASQVGGGLVGTAGLLGETGAYSGPNGSSGWLSNLKGGGRIHRDTGGGLTSAKNIAPAGTLVPAIPNFDVDFIPTAQGKGVPNLPNPGAPKPPQSSSGGQSSSSAMSGLSGLANMVGSLVNTPSFDGPDTGAGNPDSVLSTGSNSNLTGFLGGSDAPAAQDGSVDVLSSGQGLGNTGSVLSTAGDGAASSGGAGMGSSFLSNLGGFFNMNRGGNIPQFKPTGHGRYAVGGEVLPDVVSGIGDIVGAFFGDPGAGDQGVGILSNADGGATKGEGVEGQILGGFNDDNEDKDSGTPGQGLNALFDLNTDNNPITANTSGSEATQQQKEGMGPVAGLKSQVGNGAGVATAFFNKGGRTRFDGGGSISSPLTPDQILAEQTEIQALSPSDDQTPAAPANTPSVVAPTQTAQPSQQVAPQDSTPIPQYTPPTQAQPQAAPAQDVARQPYRPVQHDPVVADPWQALATAGFSAMAGRSPSALENIGQGALAGVQQYGEEKKEAASQNLKNEQVQQEGQRLADQAEFQNKQLAQTGKYQDSQVQARNKEIDQQGLYQTGELASKKQELANQAKYQQAQIDNMRQERGKPISDGYGGFIQLDPKTGTYSPISVSGNGASGSNGPSISNLYNHPKDANGNPLKGDAYLATLPPAVAQQAKSYVAGNSSPPSGFASKDPKLAAAWQAAQESDDGFSATAGTRYKTIQDFANPNGKTGQTIKSQNVVMEHIQTLRNAVDALNNGDVPAFNKIANTVASQTGQPAPTNFELGRELVSDEIAKAVLGTAGGVADRQGIKDALSPSASHDQAYQALDQAGQYMAGQASGVEQSYRAGTQLNNFRDRFMAPASKALLDKYYPVDKSGKPVSQGTSSKSTSGTTSLPKSLPWVNGLQFNPKRQQYRDSAGNVYDINGNKVQ